MAEQHDLQNQSTNLDTKAINASIRKQTASLRKTILDAGIIEQSLVMFQTGFNCTIIDGKLKIHDGLDGEEKQVLPHDIRQKFGKLLIDKAVPTPTAIAKDEDTGSTFLKNLEADHNRLQLANEKRRASEKIIVIEPEPVDSNGVGET